MAITSGRNFWCLCSSILLDISTPAPAETKLFESVQVTPSGEYTFGIIRRDVDDILTVSDAQLVDGMRFFAERMKIVVEPTGCLAAAGVLQGAIACGGKRVGILLSGGNIDLKTFSALLERRAFR